jgi:hypothetical protein
MDEEAMDASVSLALQLVKAFTRLANRLEAASSLSKRFAHRRKVERVLRPLRADKKLQGLGIRAFVMPRSEAAATRDKSCQLNQLGDIVTLPLKRLSWWAAFLLKTGRQICANWRRLAAGSIRPCEECVRADGLSDRMIGTTHSELSTLWRFSKDRRQAHCVLLPHPNGFELRYFFNDVILIGMVSREYDQLIERARQWRLRLVADGWLETEHSRPRMMASRA